MKKILFISKNYKNGMTNGGNEVSKRNYQILNELYEVDELLFEFKASILKKIYDTLTCNSLNFNKLKKIELEKKIIKNRYDYVWLDSSLYGSVSKYIKKIDKNLKMIIFFHNIEYYYFWEKTKVEGIKNLIMLPYAYFNEKRAIMNADKLIVLNNRDSDKLKKLYKKETKLMLPLTLKDNFQTKNNRSEEKINNKRALFVGTNFFANVQGITWFIDEVMPNLKNVELIIVGSGMDKLKILLEGKSERIKVLGFVNDIAEEYEKADFIVAPIFYGSGMKTKTTEALMYGKTIYGTTEAFEGFELDYMKVGGVCNTKEEFIDSINNFNREKNNKYSREIYLKKYSNESVKNKLREIIK